MKSIIPKINKVNKYERTKSDDSDAGYDSTFDDSSLKIPHGHFKQETSIGTKIHRIKEGHTPKALANRKKIKDNKCNCASWCRWYWQKPFARFPFLYFLLMFLSPFALSIYWIMDNDSAFILTAIISLSMCFYATIKFKTAMALKKEVVKYRGLTLQHKIENVKLEAEIKRASNAISMLKKTRRRLAKSNKKNGENLIKFEEIEKNMASVSKEANMKVKEVNRMTKSMRQKWREEHMNNERDMLHAVFNRYERRHTQNSNLGMKREDFEEFQKMLPERYAQRFDRMGTFSTFACNKSMIDIRGFENTLDVFAEMDTDNKDINLTLNYKKPAELEAPKLLKLTKVGGHQRREHLDDISFFEIDRTASYDSNYGIKAVHQKKKKKQIKFKK